MTPIVIFAYNRADHLAKTLQALEQAGGAEQTELFIFADGYKGEKDKNKVLEVHDYLNGYKARGRFKEIHVVLAEKNRGLAESVIQGVSQIVQKYGAVIVVEDDLVVTPDFIVYMNEALEHYKNQQQVWAISGWAPELDELSGLKEDTFFWYRSSSWGWATWQDRWEKVDWSIKNYSSFRYSWKLRKKMNRGGADMADMLDMQMQGVINSWAIRFAYAESMDDGMTVFPTVSKVTNCGQDGSGTNCHAVNVEKKEIYRKAEKAERDRVWGESLPDKNLCRKLYRYYSGSRLHCAKWRLKSILNRLGIKKF